MTVGPLHLVVVSFNDDKVVAEIGKQLGIVRKRGIIRLFDFLYVLKHPDGSLAFKEMSDLSSDEKYQYGGVIKSLIGLVVDEGQDLTVSTVAEVPGLAEHDFGINDDELHYIADKIAPGQSAILLLLEHRWAIGLKEAIVEAGGTTLLQGLVNPEAFKIVGTELEVLLDAAKRLEDKAVSDAMAIMPEATAAKEEAEAEAEALQVKMAAAAVAAAEERAQKAMAEAQEVEEITAAKAALLRETAEQDRAQAAEVRAAAEQVKEKAVTEAREVVAASKVVEALAMEEAADVLEQAHHEEEDAIRRAAAVMEAANDAEARAIMRAINALLAAEIIEQEAMEEAVQAVIAAQVVEDMAAKRAGLALLSGSLR